MTQSLEREPAQQFDLLALDAFSSDSIPVHLLTKEAFQVYGHHLKTNGVIAVHISNHFLDLEPVVSTLAKELKYEVALVDFEEEDEDWWNYASSWMLVTRDKELLNCASIRAAKAAAKKDAPKVPLWTDDFASLYQILK